MRKLYNYQVIRYFPNVNSDEFFNVGIYLADEKSNKLYFIKDEHLAKLILFPSIDRKNIITFIKMLSKEINISHWYGNNLKFSNKKVFRSSQSFEEILEILYEDYIGYKFHFKEKKDSIEIIKQNTRDIIKREFKNYVDINENTIFDFEIINKRNKFHHYSNIGSISNKDNIKDMSWDVESFLVSNENLSSIKFQFLNIKYSHDDVQVANNILYKSHIESIAYYDEETRYKYLKEVADI